MANIVVLYGTDDVVVARSDSEDFQASAGGGRDRDRVFDGVALDRICAGQSPGIWIASPCSSMHGV